MQCWLFTKFQMRYSHLFVSSMMIKFFSYMTSYLLVICYWLPCSEFPGTCLIHFQAC